MLKDLREEFDGREFDLPVTIPGLELDDGSEMRLMLAWSGHDWDGGADELLFSLAEYYGDEFQESIPFTDMAKVREAATAAANEMGFTALYHDPDDPERGDVDGSQLFFNLEDTEGDGAEFEPLIFLEKMAARVTGYA